MSIDGMPKTGLYAQPYIRVFLRKYTVMHNFVARCKMGLRKTFVALRFRRVGEWRSLVAHLFWEQRVAGSNPVSPTIY
jgi:hypothetical protein